MVMSLEYTKVLALLTHFSADIRRYYCCCCAAAAAVVVVVVVVFVKLDFSNAFNSVRRDGS